MPIAPLFRGKGVTTVAYGKCGKGDLIVLGSAWALSNDGVKFGDNLMLVLNAVRRRDPQGRLPVMFDEFHHGYGSAPGITSLIGPSARLGILQLGMAFLLLLFASARRFGRPVYLREGARFRSEYLSSMSSLLRRARSVKVVRDELDRKFRGDISRRLGLPPDTDAETMLAILSERHPDKVNDFRALIRGEHALDERAIMALQVRRNQFRKDLNAR